MAVNQLEVKSKEIKKYIKTINLMCEDSPASSFFHIDEITELLDFLECIKDCGKLLLIIK